MTKLTYLLLTLVLMMSLAASASALGPEPVDLRTAGDFVILSKTGITDVPTSSITGNVGTSPITGAANGLSCADVTGNIYSVDAAGPAPCSIVDDTRLTAAVGDMQTAYTNAAGRSGTDYLNMGAGDVSGLTLEPGIYTWGTGVLAASDFTLSGGPNDVWIFQVAQDLTIGNGVIMQLTGGAQPQNIFWQVGGQATLGTTSQFSGILLSQTAINVQTGASVDGRLLAQTEVTLQSNEVTQPSGSTSTGTSGSDDNDNTDNIDNSDSDNSDTTSETGWNCGSWSVCSASGTQTRSCSSDGTSRSESRNCNSQSPNEPQAPNEEPADEVVEEDTTTTPTTPTTPTTQNGNTDSNENNNQAESTTRNIPQWMIILAVVMIAVAGIGAFAFKKMRQ